MMEYISKSNFNFQTNYLGVTSLEDKINSKIEENHDILGINHIFFFSLIIIFI